MREIFRNARDAIVNCEWKWWVCAKYYESLISHSNEQCSGCESWKDLSIVMPWKLMFEWKRCLQFKKSALFFEYKNGKRNLNERLPYTHIVRAHYHFKLLPLVLIHYHFNPYKEPKWQPCKISIKTTPDKMITATTSKWDILQFSTSFNSFFLSLVRLCMCGNVINM